MNTSCFRKEEKRIEAQWENTLLLPGCAGMPENVGLAGAYSGIVEGKLLVLGGANFPDKYPWEGGIKTWWATLYSYDLDTEEWTVYDDFLDRPLAYGVSISLPEGLLCIGGCDHARCSDKVFLIKKEIDSFVIDSVSFPSFTILTTRLIARSLSLMTAPGSFLETRVPSSLYARSANTSLAACKPTSSAALIIWDPARPRQEGFL